MTMALLCLSLLREWQALISSVGIRLSRLLKSFHLPLLRLARAWLRGNNVVVSPSLITAVSLSCFVALVIVDVLVSMMFSRSSLCDSGALFRSSADWWIADGNPIACISGHVSPVTFLSVDDAEVISILHRGWVSPVVELSIPVWVWPACRCILTDRLERVSVFSKCILSCLPGAISLAPSSVLNIFRLYFRCRLEMKFRLVVPFAREG